MSWQSILGYTAAGSAVGAGVNAVLNAAFGVDGIGDLLSSTTAPHDVLQQFTDHPNALGALGGYITPEAPHIVDSHIYDLDGKTLLSNMGLGEIRMHASAGDYHDAVKLITNHMTSDNYQVDYSKAFEQLRALANEVPGITFADSANGLARAGDIIVALNDTDKGYLVLPQDVKHLDPRLFSQAFIGSDISPRDVAGLYVATHNGDETSILRSATHGAISGAIGGSLFGTIKHFSDKETAQPALAQSAEEAKSWQERIAAENAITQAPSMTGRS